MKKKRLFFLITMAFWGGIFLCQTHALEAVSLQVGGFRINKKTEALKTIRGKNIVRQSLDYSCGPAGLATVLNYYLDDPISEKQIINQLLKTTDIKKVIQRKGFSLLDLKRFAEARGYKATGYKLDVASLQELQKPVLVPIKFKNYRHFIVIKGIIEDRVFIADPTVGNTTMKVSTFKRIWQDGIALLIEHSEKVRRDPFKCYFNSRLYAHKAKTALPQYENIMRTMESHVLRTAVFPNEF